ncbi:hypothetical protein SG34_001010 [Thalassomonas viridans]|uniref:Uncharacterized protein n=1 Tax=Thalassomonas viridans TaxID=137584 RepID=A0AAE9Z3D6_9GAMM|nr:hypothetical protein [Thalassomonas viridans]WDE05557.1 hypothetical protein SG34_001010 [Thalassomonas viridans]
MNTEPYQVDPALRDAFNHLAESGKYTSKEIELVTNTVMPVKAFLQVNSEVSHFFTDLDWASFYGNLLQPAKYSQSLESLSEIQEEALKKFSAGQRHLVETITHDSEEFMQVNVEADEPQQLIAGYMDQGLKAYDDIKQEMIGQTKAFSEMNSAYMAWMQQTLELFGQGKDSNRQ